MEQSYWSWALGMLGAHAGFTAISWFWLPPRIPMHFNAAGVADAWMGASIWTWFGLLLPSIFIYLLIYALSRPETMATWNIPEKQRFEKLTREQQVPVIKLMSLFGAGTAAAVIALFLAIQVGMYLSAIGISRNVLPWYIVAFMTAVPVGILVAIIPWSNSIKRAITEADSSDSRYK